MLLRRFARLFATLGLSCAAAQTVHPIDLNRLEDRTQFQFLSPLLKNVELVSLGESIHLTREFPLVRIGIVRYLHENLGFDVLAMEGSAEDIWIAQDRLLNSPRGQADAEMALTGLFEIWNTSEMRQLVDYEIASWNSPRPFYITAYDIQPGTGQGSRGTEVFRLLAGRLRNYAPPPTGFDESQWIADLAPVTRACGEYKTSDADRVGAAIRILERWTAAAAPAVAARFPHLPHAAVLGLIPDNLRASLALCQSLGARDWGRYKGQRDMNAALYATRLKGAAPGQKLILWAHLSHVSYNSEHVAASVGEALRQTFGSRIYTIVPFAESGLTIQLFSDVNDDIAYSWVHGTRSELGRKLSQLSKQDYFLDVRASTDPLFTTPQSLWGEAREGAVTLASDLDGILWIKSVHAPQMLPRSAALMFWTLTAAHYQTPLLVGGAILLGCSIWALMRRRARKLRRAV